MMHTSTLRLSAVAAAAILATGTAVAQTSTATVDTDLKQTTTLPQVNVRDRTLHTQQTNDWRRIEHSTATDLKDVLADEPAVQMGGGNGASQWWTIRGVGQDQIDVVVDGASSDAQIYHHQGRFSLDPSLVKIIQIDKGTGSASSGIGATAGRIEAATVDALDLLRDGQDIGFRANLGASSNKGANAGFSVYGRSGMFDALFAANRVDDKDYKDGSGQKVIYSALDNDSMLAKVGLTVTPNLRLTLGHRREQQEGIRSIKEEFYSTTDKAADPSQLKRTTSSTTFTASGKNHGFMDTIDFDLAHMKIEQERGANSKRPNMQVEMKSLTSNLRMSSRIAGDHLIKYGLNYRDQEATGTYSRNAKLAAQKKTDTGAYVEGIWNFAPVTLTTGLRYDHFSLTSNNGTKKSASAVSPSIGLIYDVNNELALSISHNRALRSPRFREVLNTNGPIRFADNLQAEKAANTEVGLSYHTQQFSFKGAYFVQTINHLQNITKHNCNKTTEACEYYLMGNEGKLTNRGYELHGSYRVGDLTARAGVSYSTPKVSGKSNYDDRLVAMPMGRQWNLGLSYKLAPANLELGWRARFAQSRSYMNGTNLVSRPGYGVHDLTATWLPLGKDTLAVNFAINNVGDKLYRSHSQRAGTISMPEAGRDIRLNVSYRY